MAQQLAPEEPQDSTVLDGPPDDTADDAAGPTHDLAAEDLVEEISIDGMCGVY